MNFFGLQNTMTTLDFSSETMTDVNIRTAVAEDVEICANFDAAYTTEYVWQMQLTESEWSHGVEFSRLRLPRKMSVTFPFRPAEINAMLYRAQYMLVATLDETDEIIGYVMGSIEPWRQSLNIDLLLVRKDARRQRVGQKLLGAVRALALENEAMHINFSVQTKNDPAIKLARQQGAILCGYNDRLYPNGDIALLYTLQL